MGLKEYNGKLTGNEDIGIMSEGQRYYIKLSEIKDFINPDKPKPKKAVKEK